MSDSNSFLIIRSCNAHAALNAKRSLLVASATDPALRETVDSFLMTYDDMMDAMTKVTAALKKSEEEIIKLKEENSKLNGYVHAQSARLEHFEQERTMMQGLLNRLSSDITSEAKQKADASVSSSHAEATMHDSGNASILRRSDTAVEPDAAKEHIGMAWLSTSDDVTLIAIFEHFANCYIAMPMVGTCKRILITWTRKRRQFALEELTKLRCWFYKQDICVAISISICDRIEALIR